MRLTSTSFLNGMTRWEESDSTSESDYDGGSEAGRLVEGGFIFRIQYVKRVVPGKFVGEGKGVREEFVEEKWSRELPWRGRFRGSLRRIVEAERRVSWKARRKM